MNKYVKYGAAVIGFFIFLYWLFLAPLPQSYLLSKKPDIESLEKGKINVLPVNSPKVSAEEFAIIKDLFAFNNGDMSGFRFVNYFFDDVSDQHIIGAQYVVNGVPIDGLSTLVYPTNPLFHLCRLTKSQSNKEMTNVPISQFLSKLYSKI